MLKLQHTKTLEDDYLQLKRKIYQNFAIVKTFFVKFYSDPPYRVSWTYSLRFLFLRLFMRSSRRAILSWFSTLSLGSSSCFFDSFWKNPTLHIMKSALQLSTLLVIFLSFVRITMEIWDIFKILWTPFTLLTPLRSLRDSSATKFLIFLTKLRTGSWEWFLGFSSFLWIREAWLLRTFCCWLFVFISTMIGKSMIKGCLSPTFILNNNSINSKISL